MGGASGSGTQGRGGWGGDGREDQGLRAGVPRGAGGVTGSAALSPQQGTPVQPSSICRAPTSFQQRVERFHENPGVRELLPDTYVSRTIALVNCGPPLR